MNGDQERAGRVGEEFARLAERLLQATTVADVLKQVVAAACTVLPGADMVSVTLQTEEGQYSTPVATDQTGIKLDELQYTLGEGPCVEATRVAGTGMVDDSDLGISQLWPQWGPSAADMGIHSVLAFGLFPTSDPPRSGALNLYSYSRNGLDGIDRDVAMLLAAHATSALATTRAVTAAELEAAQLREALRSRDVIGQAKGILMQRRDIDADEAFEILRQASQRLNIKLVRLAHTVVTRRNEL